MIDDVSVASLSPLKRILLSERFPLSCSSSNIVSSPEPRPAATALFTKNDTDESRALSARNYDGNGAGNNQLDDNDDALLSVSASPSPNSNKVDSRRHFFRPQHKQQPQPQQHSGNNIHQNLNDYDDDDLSPISAQRHSRFHVTSSCGHDAAAVQSAGIAPRPIGRARATKALTNHYAPPMNHNGSSSSNGWGMSSGSSPPRSTVVGVTPADPPSSRPAIQSLFRHFGGRLRFAHMSQMLYCASLPNDPAACDAVWFDLVSGMAAVPYVSEGRFVEVLQARRAAVLHPLEWPDVAESNGVHGATPSYSSKKEVAAFCASSNGIGAPSASSSSSRSRQRPEDHHGDATSKNTSASMDVARDNNNSNNNNLKNRFDPAVPVINDRKKQHHHVVAAAAATSSSSPAHNKNNSSRGTPSPLARRSSPVGAGRKGTAAFAPPTHARSPSFVRTPSPKGSSQQQQQQQRRKSTSELSLSAPALQPKPAVAGRNAIANCPFGIASAGDRPPMFPTSAATSAPAPALVINVHDHQQLAQQQQQNQHRNRGQPSTAAATSSSSRRSSPSPVPPLPAAASVAHEPAQFTHIYDPAASAYTEPFDRGDELGSGGRSHNVFSPEKQTKTTAEMDAGVVPAALKLKTSADKIAAPKRAASATARASSSTSSSTAAAAAAGMNASADAAPVPIVRTRSADRLNQQRSSQRRKQLEEREEELRRQRQECTFKPQINAKSRSMAAAAMAMTSQQQRQDQSEQQQQQPELVIAQRSSSFISSSSPYGRDTSSGSRTRSMSAQRRTPEIRSCMTNTSINNNSSSSISQSRRASSAANESCNNNNSSAMRKQQQQRQRPEEPFKAMYVGAPSHDPLLQEREIMRRAKRSEERLSETDLAECTFAPKLNPFVYADEELSTRERRKQQLKEQQRKRNNELAAAGSGSAAVVTLPAEFYETVQRLKHGNPAQPVSARSFFEQLRSEATTTPAGSAGNASSFSYSSDNSKLLLATNMSTNVSGVKKTASAPAPVSLLQQRRALARSANNNNNNSISGNNLENRAPMSSSQSSAFSSYADKWARQVLAGAARDARLNLMSSSLMSATHKY